MSDNKMKRTCAYCGQPKCRCPYREGKMGEFTISMSNVSEQSTLGEILEAISRTFVSDPSTPAVFRLSVTYLDAKKLAKAKAKRTQEVPNALSQ